MKTRGGVFRCALPFEAGEIAPAVEAFRPTDGGDKSGCDDRADARDCRQPPSLFVLLHPADELGVESRDLSIEFRQLRASVADEQIIRRLNRAPPCSSISTPRNCSSFRLPCGATIPRSSRMARK